MLKAKDANVMDFFGNKDEYFLVMSPMGITVIRNATNERLYFRIKEEDFP